MLVPQCPIVQAEQTGSQLPYYGLHEPDVLYYFVQFFYSFLLLTKGTRGGCGWQATINYCGIRKYNSQDASFFRLCFLFSPLIWPPMHSLPSSVCLTIHTLVAEKKEKKATLPLPPPPGVDSTWEDSPLVDQ
jgi:hypothetical protein